MKLFPVSEPPLSYILFSGMSMMGAALGRSVYLNLDIHTIYPMLNLLLIGPSGIGKSTAIDAIGMRLLESLPRAEQPQIIRDSTTREKLHADLVIEPHAIVVASELAVFFTKEKYKEGMVPYVTRLLDYRPSIDTGTRKDGSQTVYEPSVTVIGGSTVDWLQDQLPDSAAKGGFLARFFIVKEDHKYQRVADPGSMLSTSQWAELASRRTEAYTEFRRLVVGSSGPIAYKDFDAKDAYGLWYNTQMPETGYLAPFSARAGEFVLRFAMLLAISRRHSWLEGDDIRAAIKLYDYAASKLQEVVVPFTPAGKLIAQVLQVIGSQPMTDVQIKRAMRNSSTAQDVDRILASLLQSRDIIRDSEGKFRRANTPKKDA